MENSPHEKKKKRKKKGQAPLPKATQMGGIEIPGFETCVQVGHKGLNVGWISVTNTTSTKDMICTIVRQKNTTNREILIKRPHSSLPVSVDWQNKAL